MAIRRERKENKKLDPRTWVGVIAAVFTAAIVGRLFLLQVVNHGLYVALAEGQHALTERLVPDRGEVFFHDGPNPDDISPLIANREKRLVYAEPKRITDPAATAEKLAEVLTLDPDAVRARLDKPGDSYEPIAHGVEVETAEKVMALGLTGIATSPEMTRFYPLGALAGHLTGFLGYDDDRRKGLYGLEGYYEQELAGEAGRLRGDGSFFELGASPMQEARDGDNLLLTIDRTIQNTACEKLEQAVRKHGARGGEVIIVHPRTGSVLAMCTMPSYDPNDYPSVGDPSIYTNGAIFDEYEPGSVMKTMTLAAAIDQGLITPETTFDDSGSVQIGKYTIRNADEKKYGVQTMNQVLEQSINTGAILTVQKLGTDRFRDYLERFGFGTKTGIPLQGENDGDISTLSKSGEIYAATASFGQGMAVTPLQLLMAYAALVNDGKLMKPRLVEAIIKPNGFRESIDPETVREVVSPDTARLMKAMMVNVVRNGHGQRAGVPGYYVGGKTGTAQIPYGDRPGYKPDEHIGTFVGFAPLTDPAFVMLTKIDVPRDVRFAESSVAPLFGDLAAFLLNYYRVPPDDARPDS